MKHRRSEFEEREWQLMRAYALGTLSSNWCAWLWLTWWHQARTWRKN